MLQHRVSWRAAALVSTFVSGWAAIGSGAALAGYPAPAPGGRYVYAPIVAIEQPIFYNRFGSFNPYGMLYALRRDVVDHEGKAVGEQPVRADGQPMSLVELPPAGRLAGKASLRQSHRPRPLVLRGNVGDILIVDLQNLLPTSQPDLQRCREDKRYKEVQTRRPDGRCGWSQSSDNAHYDELRPEIPPAEWPEGRTERQRRQSENDEAAWARGAAGAPNGDWPLTRTVSLAVPGIEVVRCDGSAGAPEDAAAGLRAIPPNASQRYCFRLDREGTFLFSSLGAPAGGEGDGGSLSHGLFGAINVEPRGSDVYRSQVSEAVLNEAKRLVEPGKPNQPAFINFQAIFKESDPKGLPLKWGPYDKTLLKEGYQPDTPVLNMHKKAKLPRTNQGVLELVHGDVTAIVDRCPDISRGALDQGTCAFRDAPAIREYTIVFHDELKTFYPDELKELESEENAFGSLADKPLELGGGFNPLAGVRDGFAINYGSSGMGAILLANRKDFGPAKDCVDCAYEEFFLGSWANGDPALRAEYADDPSNVYHSYLGDPVVFRNSHAGPKETHVFHLHAHQWLAQQGEPGAPAPDGLKREYGTYLDSQTIAPMQGFSYEIYHGGSGNLNLTPGDSIFHCHLYPHFAQGMWGLWRVHDVFENGSVGRRLPDAELGTTPTPAIVPLPGKALAPMPSEEEKFAGYPFYIAGAKGRRAPQAPHDIAEGKDGGLPRHIVAEGERTISNVTAQERDARAVKLGIVPGDTSEAGRKARLQFGRELVRHALVTGDFSNELEGARIEVLAADGTAVEKVAMQFHSARLSRLEDPLGRPMLKVELPPLPGEGADPPFDQLRRDDPVKIARLRQAGYRSHTPDGRSTLADGSPVVFRVNGSTGAPGAPFADPCRDVLQRPRGGTEFVPENVWINMPRLTRYDVSAIPTPIVVNAKGWHDPQGRINVLDSDVPKYPPATATGYAQETKAKPFFFRAHSGDCIEFRHTNRTPKELALDDFQVRTPTDTIGQHIHLVKFDVTASDGSGNGFNYEDGTFARDALAERLEAAYRWRADGNPLSAATNAVVDRACSAAIGASGKHCNADFQTTIQRWYAEPILSWVEDGKGKEVKADRTLRTVFTHDHFGPSSIQQHGFYSALLVEPRGSEWFEGIKGAQANSGSPLMPGKAVGTQASIRLPATFHDFGYAICQDEEPKSSPYRAAWELACLRPNPDIVLHGNPQRTGPMGRTFREFAMAVADFALLYDACRSNNQGEKSCIDIVGPEHADHGLPGIVADLAKLPAAHAEIRGFPYLDRPNGSHGTPRELVTTRVASVAAHGRPVAPPKRPEAISKDHHDPYLINYRNEPIPLRIAAPRDGKWLMYDNAKGELANLFDSKVHGDPATELFQAIEDERVQVRLIQGAQEVQHMLSLHDLSWRREAGDRRSPLVGAQEIGISEHFEIGLDRMPLVPPDALFVDRIYADGTVDALWNGAWGLIRTYNSPGFTIKDTEAEKLVASAATPPGAVDESPTLQKEKTGGLVRDVLNRTLLEGGMPELPTPTSDAREPGAEIQALSSTEVQAPGQQFVAGNRNLLRSAASLGVRKAGLRDAETVPASDTDHVTCPREQPGVRFTVEAWSVGAWLGNSDGATEAAGSNGTLHDQAGLTYRLLHTERGDRINKIADLERVKLRNIARLADTVRGHVPPMVLRANAGECIVVELTNCLRGSDPSDPAKCRPDGDVVDGQDSDANPDGYPGQHEKGMLPRIVPFNAKDLVPSSHVDIRPQLVGWDVTAADGVRTGHNPGPLKPILPGDVSDRFVWYAGQISSIRCSETVVGQNIHGEPFPECAKDDLGKRYTSFTPVPFGAVPLSSFADVIEHGSQGLVGTLVIEPIGSVHYDPASPKDRLDVAPEGSQFAKATLENGGQEALIHWREPNGLWALPRHEMVLVYQDGRGMLWRPQIAGAADRLVPDCLVCDDSYDLGERGVSARSEPFWYRLGLTPDDGANHGRGRNLNKAPFPRDFLSSAFPSGPPASPPANPPATPQFHAKDGEVLTFRVVQPSGRARQRAFVLYGHDYPDILPRYGSAGSALVAPGRTVNAHVCDFWMEPRRTDYGYETRYCAVGGAHAGRWLWRDGPAPHFASGAWGTLIVE